MDALEQKQPLLTYDGKIGELYGIFIKNLLLQIITLGIYRFWATTNTRRYVWSRMRFQGERFEYTGTGGELFKGFLLAIAIMFGAVVGAVVLSVILRAVTGSAALSSLPLILLYLVVAVIAAGAYFSAQRYRLSRTQWRGIRGGMTGSSLVYGAYVLLYGLLCIVTLWQMWPWASLRLAERRINASSFGSLQFQFKGHAGALYGAFVGTFVGVIVWFAVLGAIFYRSLLALLPIGHAPLHTHDAGAGAVFGSIFLFYVLFIVGALLIQCLYLALLTRHVLGNTTLGTQLRFGSSITGTRLLGIMLGNLAIFIFTLGLGLPIVLHRGLRFAADTLQVSGQLDPQTLGQSDQTPPRTGEGMLNLLDHGGAF
ncbi:YjgN family protein [Paraburkholderia sp. D15]|uniref:YjgN family protein n=1 Tax=Paraburkholderia sp. D15 TaxID=2880218 RepID=UPI0024794B99|nr:YjgN family protein [Paraburkholderia sp. D15]WGS54288.1 YjgN family protein [Paraburkholderia sp. D15]